MVDDGGRVGRLAGRRALVTGALGGIGEAIAAAFVAEGASVLVTDVADTDVGRVRSTLGERAGYHPLDVRDPAQWRTAVDAAVDRFGGLDALVNNAGAWRPGPLETLDVDAVRLMFEVNQLGVLLGMQAVIPPFREAGGGTIVNIASGAGTGGYPGQIAYGATKWAVRGMTRTAAMELGPLGVRVNAICPGSIDTPMTAAIKRPPGNPFHFLPVPRRGEPAEVASAAVHLSSHESSYTTAADVVVDGGLGAGPVMPAPRT